MIFIPTNNIPWADPPMYMDFGNDKGRLLTSDWGGKFQIEGDIKIAAKAVLEHALFWMNYGGLGTAFSRFEFNFRNGIIEVEARPTWKDDEKTITFIEEVRYWASRYNKLKAFW